MNEYEPQQPPRKRSPSDNANAGAGHTASITAETNDLVRRAFASARTDDEGWAYLQELDSKLRSVHAGFRPSRFGFKTLAELLAACDGVETGTDRGGAFMARLPVASNADPRALPPAVPSATSKPPNFIEHRGTTQIRGSARNQSRERGQPSEQRPLARWAVFLDERNQPYGWLLAINELRGLALKEPWEFGGLEDPKNPSPILRSYLRWTFYRLSKEKKVLTSSSLAAFNTGLVENRYEPIYALFKKNPYEASVERWPWVFKGFCIEGEGALGHELVRAFKPLPAAAHYFNDANSMFYDVYAGEPSLDTRHIVEDNCTRLPLAFIEDNCPSGFTPRDCSAMSQSERLSYTEEFRSAISSDSRRYRSMKNSLEDSVKTALKRAKWNFKTAIPQYYPTRNEMSLLLPLALVSDESPDVALVVKKETSGAYQGYTILPLAWAYNNARLVCRPNSDWLIPEKIKEGQPEEQEGGGEESSAPETRSPLDEGNRSA